MALLARTHALIREAVRDRRQRVEVLVVTEHARQPVEPGRALHAKVLRRDKVLVKQTIISPDARVIEHSILELRTRVVPTERAALLANVVRESLVQQLDATLVTLVWVRVQRGGPRDKVAAVQALVTRPPVAEIGPAVGVACREVAEPSRADKEVQLALHDVETGVDNLYNELRERVGPYALSVQKLDLVAFPALGVGGGPGDRVDKVCVEAVVRRREHHVVRQHGMVRARKRHTG